MIQEFYAWWFANVFAPFARFVIFDHLILCVSITALTITILLGCFYKEDTRSWEPWSEKWGYPLAILIVGTFFVPPCTVLAVLLLPGVAMFAVPVGGLLMLFRWLQNEKERRRLRKLWCETVHKKGEYE